MQYQQDAAKLLSQVIDCLNALDNLSNSTSSHRLDPFEPLIKRLVAIRDDLQKEYSLVPAQRKMNELTARVVGGVWGLNDPRYRSALAGILGRYQRSGKPPKARLGGLRGGRPRKDGQPTQTLERKGYSADFLPASKNGRMRIHPPKHSLIEQSTAMMREHKI
jgi:hypothetical protein